MTSIRTSVLLGLAFIGACATSSPAMAGGQPGFSAFGEDENICRHTGEAAIKASPGAGADAVTAAHQYDYAYQRCMFEHGQARQRAFWSDNAAQEGANPRENVHSFEYPDAFYSIPYATPGYGYDGFSR